MQNSYSGMSYRCWRRCPPQQDQLAVWTQGRCRGARGPCRPALSATGDRETLSHKTAIRSRDVNRSGFRFQPHQEGRPDPEREEWAEPALWGTSPGVSLVREEKESADLRSLPGMRRQGGKRRNWSLPCRSRPRTACRSCSPKWHRPPAFASEPPGDRSRTGRVISSQQGSPHRML